MPNVECFFHRATNTCTYVVWSPSSKECAIVDSVLDFNVVEGSYWTEHNEKIIRFLKEKELTPIWILETHAHADHFTAAPFLKREFPNAKVAIGEKITIVQKHFKKVFQMGEEFKADGSDFDHLFSPGEKFQIGTLQATALHTPGHTPESVSYLIQDCLFSGDTLFMPDSGSARCDFPNGSAKALFHSVKEILYNLPDNTRMFVGHDYAPNGRDFLFETTLESQKRNSIHIKADTTENDYVNIREGRDKTLSIPNLLYPALQVNIRAGLLPPYLIIPLHQK